MKALDYSAYKRFLKKEYPSAYAFLNKRAWTPLFFSETLSLSSKSYQQMEKVVKSLFQLKSQEDYQQSLSKEAPETAFHQRKQDSVLMAYDFHIDETGTPKLIEVNTNASSFLLVNSLYQFLNLDYKRAKEALKRSFELEWIKFQSDKKESSKEGAVFQKSQGIEAGKDHLKTDGGFGKEGQNTDNLRIPPPQKTLLIDEDPMNQKMAFEFFMYKDFFQSLGWDMEICHSHNLKTDEKGFLYSPQGDKVDFVYNRSTDFYFEDHPHLVKAFFKGTCAISPHPREYYLLSDKDRLWEWSLQKENRPELEKIKHNLLFSGILKPENKEQVWKNRKKYFFKIRRGHAGKRAYRGASLSYKKFDELVSVQSLFQEFSPPSKITDSQSVEWKVDFRAYVYENIIQQLTARCYQGQLTNFKKAGSGFAPVHIL